MLGLEKTYAKIGLLSIRTSALVKDNTPKCDN